MKKLSLIIVNWNGLKDTLSCLSTIRQGNINNFSLEIIVVDNNSKNNEADEIKKAYPEIILIKNNKNLGFAGGNNRGIKNALERNSDYILLLNNDTLIEKNLLENLVSAGEENKKAGIVSPKIYFAPGFEYHFEKYKEEERGKVIWYAGGTIDWDNILFSHKGVDEVDIGQFDKEKETDFATGCAMLIKKEVFEKIGLLDEKYFMYLEDADFCIRAKKAGFKTYYEPKCSLWHKNAQSSGKPGSLLHIYYITRNRLLFGMRYGEIRTKFALLREAVKLVFRMRTERQAVFDFITGNFGKGSICGDC